MFVHTRTYMQYCTLNIAESVSADLEIHDNGRKRTECQGHHGDSGTGSTASGGGWGRSSGGSGRHGGRFDISRTSQNVRLVRIA